MMGEFSSFMVPVLGIIVAAFVAAVYLETKKLVITARLKSRKAFNEFDPQAFLFAISKESYLEVKKLTQPESKKNKLVVRWKYTTPSGKKTSVGSKKYTLDEVKAYVEKLDPVFQKGEARVAGLNALYTSELAMGREIEDEVPKIYCYMIPGSADHLSLVKVGYAKGNAHKRIEDQFKTAARLKIDYTVLFIQPAITITDETFMDHKVHRILKSNGVKNPEGEWFQCDAATALKATHAAQANETRI